MPGEALEPLVDEVRRRLCGEVDAPCIRRAMEELLRSEFADARVTAYVPILLTRRVCEVLRTGPTPAGGTR
ncbi:MAG: hypothetical protein KIT17_22735 [Rubrivivax sp.]|nr:hypothetical protein [Rubrivivax sp.]